MKIYNIDEDYIKYLKKYDSKVPNNKSELRPYIGIVLNISGIKYYAPLTSPKQKHLKMKNDKDFRKINGGTYGAINFNNMIPVEDKYVYEKDICNESDIQYKNLLLNQLRHINKDAKTILKVASELRELYLKNESILTKHEMDIKSRCCNFILLEQIYSKYQQNKDTN